MLVTIDTPYADTTAADLSFALDAAEQPALHVVELTVAEGVDLRLCLLGASHQVVLRTPAARLVETVACLAGRPGGLPEAMHDRATGYRFSARVRRLPAPVLARRVDDLRRELAGEPYALVGLFPGGPDAVTALRASTPAPSTIAWQTWHSYPQSGELVETETVVFA